MALPPADYPNTTFDGNEQTQPVLPEGGTDTANALDYNKLSTEVVAVESDLRSSNAITSQDNHHDLHQDLETRLAAVEAGGLSLLAARAEASVSFTPAVSGTKASGSSTLASNPPDGNSVSLFSYFDDLGNSGTATSDGLVAFTFRAVLGAPYSIVGNGAVDVRIEASSTGTLANLIAAASDVLVNTDTGYSLAGATTVTNPSGTDLNIEQDFVGAVPNFQNAIEQPGIQAPDWNPAQVSYAGGVDATDPIITEADVSAFEVEIPSSGPRLLIGSDLSSPITRMKAGTTAPESAISISDPTIVDAANTVFADFPGIAGETYRGITIAPTQDLVTGTATVSWTFDGAPFSVEVTKS